MEKNGEGSNLPSWQIISTSNTGQVKTWSILNLGPFKIKPRSIRHLIVSEAYLLWSLPFKSCVEVVSKPHLTPKYYVVSFFEMLTYYHVCCAFSSTRALSLDAIWGFETTSNNIFLNQLILFRMLFPPIISKFQFPEVMSWQHGLLSKKYLTALKPQLLTKERKLWKSWLSLLRKNSLTTRSK